MLNFKAPRLHIPKTLMPNLKHGGSTLLLLMLIIHLEFYSPNVNHCSCSLSPSWRPLNTQWDHTLQSTQLQGRRQAGVTGAAVTGGDGHDDALPCYQHRDQATARPQSSPRSSPSPNTSFFPFYCHQKKESTSPTTGLVPLATKF